MGINSTEVSYGFGQMGSAFLKDTAAFTPPTGKVVVAIQILETTDFDALTPDTSGYELSGGDASGAGAAFIGTTSPVAANGTNADQIATDGTDRFGGGTVLFGRWTNVQLASGKIIMYFGE